MKKCTIPGKTVIEYYQTYQDARVRYKQIMELFDYEPDFLLMAPDREVLQLSGDITAKDLCYTINDDVQLLNNISLSLKAGRASCSGWLFPAPAKVPSAC